MMRSREDTTEIVRFTLRLETPAQEGRDAVDASIKWLREMRLTCLRTERIKTTAVTFERHTAGFDVVLVKDVTAPPFWARYCEIGIGKPIFAGP